MRKLKQKRNILSLFDGMSCGQIALNRINFKYDKYFASEIDKYAIQVTNKNYPSTIQVGDITKLKGSDFKDIYLMMAGSPCFVAGTKVVTKVGYKNIENIEIGDEVLTHKNRWGKVLNVGKNIDKHLFKIKAQGILDTFTTEDHPYYIRSMETIYNKEKRSKERFFHNPTWKIASELKKGDFLSIPIIKEEVDILNISEDEAFIIGRYIADGHTRKDFRKEIGRDKHRNWQMILSIGNDKIPETDIKHSIYPHTKNVKRMVFSSKRLVDIVEKECGSGAANKKISNTLLFLPKDMLKKVIEGLLSGDGSLRNNEHRLTTVSIELAQSLCLAVAKVYGVCANIEYTKRPKTTVIEGRIVNQLDTYTVSFRKEVKKQSKFHSSEDYIWVPFKKSELSHKGDVYNLEVDEDNSYTANNAVVHNCQGFSFSGKQLNFKDPRSALFFEFVRLLKEIKPKYFLLENVKMKKEYQDTITKYLGIEPILINSALVSAQSRQRLYWTNFPNIERPEDKNILLKDIIEEGYVDRDKSLCIDANYFKGGNLKQYFEKSRRQLVFEKPNGWNKGGIKEKDKFGTLRVCTSSNYAILDGSTWRKLTPTECEKLQTVPENYTDCVSNAQRYKMLGNGWTVDVVAHILKHLK